MIISFCKTVQSLCMFLTSPSPTNFVHGTFGESPIGVVPCSFILQIYHFLFQLKIYILLSTAPQWKGKGLLHYLPLLLFQYETIPAGGGIICRTLELHVEYPKCMQLQMNIAMPWTSQLGKMIQFRDSNMSSLHVQF